MKSLLKVLSLVLVPAFSIAQVNPLFWEPTKKQADSLRVALNKNINDTLRMAAYRELALYYLDINSDSALFFIEKDLPLAKKLNLKLWESDAYDLIAIITSNQGNYARSLKSYNAAFQIAENSDCEKNIWNISKFTDSKLPEFARLSMLAAIQSDAAELYDATENRDMQLKTIQDCLKTAFRVNDRTLLSQAFRELGGIYLREKQLDSALAYYKKSLVYSDQVGYNKYRGNSFNSIGDIYMKKKLPELALANYLIALQSSIDQNNYANIGRTYIAMANYYNNIDKNDSALYYAKLGLAMTQNTGRVTLTIMAYSTLATIYKSQKKSDSAFMYLQLATAAKDSLLSLEKIKRIQNIGFDEQLRLQELEKEKIESQNKIRTYTLLAGLGVFLAIGMILYRNNRQKQKANKVLETTLTNLKSTQSQLIQSEKMASLGELTAGIAHEIQNPLNFVNNFSEVNTELIEEMKEEIDKGNLEDAKAIANDIKENEQKINDHGKRADAIVKGMLQHSRSSNGVKESTDINKLADEYLRLAYHGLRAKDKSFNATMKTDFDETIGNINIIPQDIGRVILNLITNAFYAVDEKMKSGFVGYEPTILVTTKKSGDTILISVKDNGNGIPQKVLDKIFQPFFTTKPTGQGTGLGLSLSYDIIKAYGGEIKVESKEGEGSTFTIQLLLNKN
ncbi:ATP-binding protein [Ferruginibacter sp.]|uniref:ATP-binding protein n=1 Tax=Ferruginibacter sp. TaxID=1940288 RepID=UPI002658666B|nr:ATP-binding protein [Ferruginibacter sp.]